VIAPAHRHAVSDSGYERSHGDVVSDVLWSEGQIRQQAEQDYLSTRDHRCPPPHVETTQSVITEDTLTRPERCSSEHPEQHDDHDLDRGTHNPQFSSIHGDQQRGLLRSAHDIAL
jgi:hypothetical protein